MFQASQLNFPALSLSIALCLPGALPAHELDEDHHDLDGKQHAEQHAHVHGESRLTLAQDSTQLSIEWRSPAFDLFGFEREPNSDAERALIKATTNQLKNLATLLTLPKAAQCSVKDVVIESPLLDQGQAEDNHQHDSAEGSESHADVIATYQLKCQAPESIHNIEVNLFNSFRSMEKISMEWILNDSQGATIATPEKTSIKI